MRRGMGREQLVSGEDGYQALEIVDAIYRSCRTGEKVALA
jgi:predicted dehydrogenase